MYFSLYENLNKKSGIKALVKWYIRRKFWIPASIKLQLANEIHAEMLSRLTSEILTREKMSKKDVYKIFQNIGTEMADITMDLLSLNKEDASSLANIVDFLHSTLLIKGKKTIAAAKEKSESHWYGCPLGYGLNQKPYGAYYCHIYQEMYKGLLKKINPSANANDLTITRSQGNAYCQLITTINE